MPGSFFLDSLAHDFLYALRGFGKDRRFVATAIIALALGIGATTMMFSVVYNVVIDPFPYKAIQRSVVLELKNLANTGGWKGRDGFTAEEFKAFQEENRVFEDMIGAEVVRVFYDDGKATRRLENGAAVTTNTFEYLGVPAMLGRGLTAEDGKANALPVFVIHYKLWQTEFGGDPEVLGKSFVINEQPRTLVGIMPPRFNWYGASMWMPTEAGNEWISPMGRLKPGVRIETALADMNVVAHGLAKQHPGSEAYPPSFTITGETLVESVTGEFKSKLYALLGAVLLLLLIACSNVANLVLARATARTREVAVRAALGASRGRLVRELLAESFVVVVVAGASGWMLAYAGLRMIVALMPQDAIPGEALIRMNLPVLLMAIGITAVATLLCGLAPALNAVRADLRPQLTGSGKGPSDQRRHAALRNALVVAEVALSIVLLIGAGLLTKSFLVLTRVDLGFNPKNVVYVRLALPKSYDNARGKQNALTRELLERMKTMPGVKSVSESMLLPPLTYDWSDTIIPGKPHTERWETRFEICSEGFFETLGLSVLRGRLFSVEDVASERFVMVVNQSFARQYFSGEDAIGKKVKLKVLDRKFLDAPHDRYFDVLGVVSDYKTRSADPPAWQDAPMAFIPYSVQGFSWRTYMARTAVDDKSLIKSIGSAVREIDPGAAVSESGTIEGSLKEYYKGPQFELSMLGAFSGIGLALVVVGVFSVMAYTVSLQTREIGVRMALGAQRTQILWMVLRAGFVLLAAGIGIGLLASYGLTRLLASQIWGLSATDPWTFGVVVALMMAAGLAACYLPARKATEVDPLVALRYE